MANVHASIMFCRSDTISVNHLHVLAVECRYAEAFLVPYLAFLNSRCVQLKP